MDERMDGWSHRGEMKWRNGGGGGREEKGRRKSRSRAADEIEGTMKVLGRS